MEPFSTFTAWVAVIVGYLAPLAYVACATASNLTNTKRGSSCPFSPRAGWVLIVLFTGLLGWLLFIYSQYKKRTTSKL